MPINKDDGTEVEETVKEPTTEGEVSTGEETSSVPEEVSSAIEMCTSVEQLDAIQGLIDSKRGELAPAPRAGTPVEFDMEGMPNE